MFYHDCPQKKYLKQQRNSLCESMRSRNWTKDFPGGPAVKAPGFQSRVTRVWSLVGELRSYMPCMVAKETGQKDNEAKEEFLTFRKSDTRNYFCPPYTYIPLDPQPKLRIIQIQDIWKISWKNKFVKYRSHKSLLQQIAQLKQIRINYFMMNKIS